MYCTIYDYTSLVPKLGSRPVIGNLELMICNNHFNVKLILIVSTWLEVHVWLLICYENCNE